MSHSIQELSYTAGIIDGEGSICMTRQVRKGTSYFYLRVSVGTTSKRLADWLHNRYGGAMFCVSRLNERHKQPIYFWKLQTTTGCQTFLQDIFPYLLIKTSQAKLALEYCEYKIPRHHKSADSKLESEYSEKFHYLNSKTSNCE
jgi:hypothetical protein